MGGVVSLELARYRCVDPPELRSFDVATQVYEVVTDDLDGTEGAQTFSFSLDGAEYEIDLVEKNAEKLRKALERYIEQGRRVGGRRTSGRRSSRITSNASDITPKDIREWANANGYEVPNRGRIPGSIREAYEAAN
jgi:hypothetical protein